MYYLLMYDIYTNKQFVQLYVHTNGVLYIFDTLNYLFANIFNPIWKRRSIFHRTTSFSTTG